MSSKYGIDASKVRFLVGVGTDKLTDSNVNTQIEDAEYMVDRLIKTQFGSRTYSEVFVRDDGSNVFMAKKTPIQRITKVRAGGTDVTPKFVVFDSRSGRIQLTKNAEKTDWHADEDRKNFIEYKYGRLDETETETTVTANITPGNSKTITVGTNEGFSVNDYVRIVGTGTATYVGQDEVTTITGTGGKVSNITVSNLQYGKNNGARVVKMEVPRQVKRLVETEAAIRCANYMVGNTYTFATSYSIPEKSITKGVPYPHFEKVYNSLVSTREELLKHFHPEPAIG